MKLLPPLSLAVGGWLLSTWVLLPAALPAQSADEKLAALEKRLEALEEKLERLLQLVGDAKPQGPGPKYRGRSLPSWLQDLADRDDGVRRQAANALRHVGEDALPLLRTALGSEDWLLRREAVSLLGSSRLLPQSWGDLVKALGDADARVRLEAVEGLSGLHELGATPEVRKVLETVLPALNGALKDASEPVQIAAAGALAVLGNDEVRAQIPTPLLEKALAAAIDGHAWLRARAGDVESQVPLQLARTLVRRGPEGAKSALPAVARLLESSSLQVESAVLLGEIGPAAKDVAPALQEVYWAYQDSVESAAEAEGGKKAAKSKKRTVVRIVSDEEAARAAEAVKKIGEALEKIEAEKPKAERE